MFKMNDRVVMKNGDLGTVTKVNWPGFHGYALVAFDAGIKACMEGLAVPFAWLVKA